MYLTQGLHRALQQKPQAIATICDGRRHNFIQFADRVARLAGALQSIGLQAGDRVAMLSLNSDRYLEYYLAVWWAGGVVNPVNIRWSAAEIAYSLQDCDTHILIVDDTFAPMVPTLRSQAQALQTVIWAGDGGSTPTDMLNFETILASASPVPDAHRSDDDLAGIFYTGGTTGFPKGVMLSHGNMMSNSLGMLGVRQSSEHDIGLHSAPMFHLADVAFLTALLLRGGTHTFVPSFTPQGVLEAIQRDGVNEAILVPTMIQMLVDHPLVQDYDLSSLKNVVYGASVISEAVLERAIAAIPAAGFIQGYGMTELSPIATVLTPEYHALSGPKSGKLRSAGRAVLNVDVRIVDEHSVEVPLGTVGEVAVRGPNVMKGYWNKPAETAAAIRNGWMHTGDGGYMDAEGFVFIVDRIKDMIITGGENVYSAEVENALAKHPAIAMCAVIGIPDVKWGETVHAAIVCKPNHSATAAEIQEHCKALIASYKCPRSVEFRTEIPISGAGKLLKYKLREEYAARQMQG
jgi:long-chain acyl-CoA synthetase